MKINPNLQLYNTRIAQFETSQNLAQNKLFVFSKYHTNNLAK